MPCKTAKLESFSEQTGSLDDQFQFFDGIHFVSVCVVVHAAT